MTVAVFLDRDNTLIHNDGDLGDPEAVRLVKGAASAIASLRGLGYKIVVVSNQGGVARGAFGEADVQAVNERITQQVRATSGTTIDRFYYCPYHPDGKVKKYRREHPWRKPQPGMLLQAAEDLKLDLHRSWLIGDQMRDIQAASAAGVRAVLISGDRDPGPSSVSGDQDGPPAAGPSDGNTAVYWVAATIIEAVKIIAQQGRVEHATLEGSAPVPARKKKVAAPAARAAAGRDRQDKTGSEGHRRVEDHVQQGPRGPRPFRPWMTQPADDQPPEESSLESPAPRRPELPVRQPKAEPPVDDAPAPSVGQTTPADQPVTAADRVLGQILQELRSQRGMEAEFSYHHMVAIVLQMVAAVCLLGALWMGASSLDLFVRWVCVALFVQLATVAMLLFRR